MKYILWDFDDTLAYRDGKWAAALVEAVRRAHPDRNVAMGDLRPYLQSGFPWHHPERVRPAGQPADEWWSRLEPVLAAALVQGARFPEDEARRVARGVREVYIDPAYWHLFGDTLETLNELQAQGWKHVILSNHVPELPKIVHALGLSPLIHRVYTSAALGVEKPNPQAFKRVLEDLAPCEEVWMVGDSPRADVSGAEAVGIKAVLVRSEDPGVTRYAATLRDVLRWLL